MSNDNKHTHLISTCHTLLRINVAVRIKPHSRGDQVVEGVEKHWTTDKG